MYIDRENSEAIAKYCNDKFKGWTIAEFGVNEEGYVGFIVRKGKQSKIAFLLSDPEGNDVGFIEEGETI
jgi:hypothetical protein